MNYYNEFNPHAAQWLKNLIAAGKLPPAVVDSRPIQEVMPSDLTGFRQCHFFAGIGGWSQALTIAGVPPDYPVWTGSCPCQPFSVAGKGTGADDPRHLWPEFRRLIADCNPPVVFGEQVASKDGRDWLSGVRSDLEILGYGVGAADLCAAGVGAPHIRQRLWWVADSDCTGWQGSGSSQPEERWCDSVVVRRSEDSRLPDPLCDGLQGAESVDPTNMRRRSTNPSCENDDCRMGHTIGSGLEGCRASFRVESGDGHSCQQTPPPGYVCWGNNWIPCGDGKARRIKPGILPVVDGLPGRVGLISGYGNAIVPQVAAEFISAYMECDQ